MGAPGSRLRTSTSRPRALVVRLDSVGDMLVCGPAIRSVAATASRVTVLASPAGAEAARLLPGVDDVAVWTCPWIVANPAQIDSADIAGLIQRLNRARFDVAVILTSYHQSALPTALLLRLAGVPRIVAASEDYPGALLDDRVPEPPDGPEPERMLAICAAAGFTLPAGDDGRLQIRRAAAIAMSGGPASPYVVVHPGTSAPARAYPPESWRSVVGVLTAQGHDVVVTGSSEERALTAYVAAGGDPARVRDLGGRLRLGELAAVIGDAAVLVVANTGPAHLAAAVHTPVVSLFAPVVPVERWRPYGVPHIVLGDQSATCRDSRATTCPVPGHPCLSSVTPREVAHAVAALASAPRTANQRQTAPARLDGSLT